jgi:2-keto-3-deoxy-L-rhamnonate aldolase RhmA
MIGLRLRLRDGPPLLATFVILPRPEIVEIAAEAGFEAVILDREHGSLGDGDLSGMVAAASGAGLHTIVRVQECRSKLVEAALDAGADGVLVPHVSSAAAATAAVDAARFAPEGRRGVNPYVRAARYGADPGAFLDHANERAACIAMIEGPAGLQAAG